MIYKGKVDWWIGLAILGGVATPVLIAISAHQWGLLALPGLFAAFVLIVLFPQSYESTADALRIRHGVMTKLIPWPAITGVSVTSDSRSSLAMSLDRVQIEYGRGSIMIAPDDQVRFFDDIAAHCPQLSRCGMDLIISMNQ